MATARMDAVVFTDDPVLNLSARTFAEMVAARRLAAIYTPVFADAGGLIGYGPATGAGPHLAAKYVDRILRGAKPADLPVDQPTKLELVINLKTAVALGIKIPQAVVLRAERVIG